MDKTKIRLAVSLPEQVVKQLKDEAKLNYRTVSQQIEKILGKGE